MDTENKLTVTKGERWGRGINWEIGIHIYTYLKSITNKDLLYSTGNYIQYLVKTYNGKESEKGYICVCLYNWITLLYPRNYHSIVNQLYFNFKKKLRVFIGLIITRSHVTCFRRQSCRKQQFCGTWFLKVTIFNLQASRDWINDSSDLYSCSGSRMSPYLSKLPTLHIILVGLFHAWRRFEKWGHLRISL